jgi:hypothetical protein
MKTRTWCATAALFASFGFLLQSATRSIAQDDAVQDQSQTQAPDQIQAQGQDQDQSQDPPGRVARLSYSQGSVSFRPAGEDDWVTGVPNRPMITGDDLWADENSRAEVHIGSAAIRLGAKTGITFLALEDRTTQIRLAQGSLILRVRHVDDDDNYEVDTPNLAFTLLQPGEYRLDVNADGNQTVVTAFHGRGRVTGGGFNYTVVAHQSAVFTGTDHLDYDLAQAPAADDFDRWAFERDDREDRADSADYVSREMTGYEDLDEYGEWSYVAGYGPCWRPVGLVGGWAPYRFGHWAWVGPWGWTWVEDEPWGFAPFHYGRWAFVSGGWWWVPGPVVVRPVWAPALVAFVGGRPGFRFSAGVGVGWFPLAPGEVFVPSYRVSRAYVTNVNITNTSVNVTKITNVYNTVVVNKTTSVSNITYVNQHVNGGVTVVSHETFVNGRPAAQNVMRVEPKELASAPVMHRVEVEPERQSVIGAGRPAAAKPPATVISRQVVALRTPPAPPRPIDQRQAEAGGHLNQQALVRPAMPAQANQGSRTESAKSPEGFRPFTSPAGNGQVKRLPQQPRRSLEMQGTPQPENQKTESQAENRSAQASDNRRAEPEPSGQSSQPTHPLVRSAPPVQERNPQNEQRQEQKFREWQQERASTPPAQRQPSTHPAESRSGGSSKPRGR